MRACSMYDGNAGLLKQELVGRILVYFHQCTPSFSQWKCQIDCFRVVGITFVPGDLGLSSQIFSTVLFRRQSPFTERHG